MVTAEALFLLLALSGADNTVLLEFSAPWCGPCQKMKPTVERLASDGYPIRPINVDRARDLAAQHQIESVPTFVMLVDGREVARQVGPVSYDRLVQMFEQAGVRQSRQNEAAVRGQSPDRRRGKFSLPGPWAFGRQREQKPDAGTGPPPDPLQREATEPGSGTRGFAGPSEARPSGGGTQAAAGQFETRESGNGMRAATQKAMAATVRLKVEDPQGHSHATGTIIDTHDSESLIVTCGHLFRDSKGRGQISVDLFTEQGKRTVDGTLILYDLERDIAFVSMVAGVPVDSVKVAPAEYPFRVGDEVFSIGCDHGADPSVRESRITDVDKYLGPPNIEVAGQPVDGRSGGGLFSREGLLIGICNAADPADDEGIYASLPTIQQQLDRIGQRQIYRSESSSSELAAVGPPATTPASTTEPSPPAGQEGSAQKDSVGDTEVICIIRSRGNAQASERLMILDQPSRELLERLARESRVGREPREHLSGGVPQQEGDSPVVRAQSADR